MRQMTNNDKRRQQVKKYLVFALMFILFALSLLLIYLPSKVEKERRHETVGFNASIPEPKDAEIIEDKKTAYEQEALLEKSKSKLRSLQDYLFDLTSGEGTDSVANDMCPASKSPDKPADYAKRGYNSLEASGTAYRDVNRMLGSFYQTQSSAEDPEKQNMQREIEQLKNTIAQQQSEPDYEEQLALLEKSYELAAKYMPGQGIEQGTHGRREEGIVESREKIAVPMEQLTVPVVSVLKRKNDTVPVSAGFNTAVGGGEKHDKNTIRVCIHNNQTVTDNQSIQLRLLESMRTGKHVLPRNTIITGNGKIQGERLEITVTSLQYEGNIIPVELTVYDYDGQRGVFIPNSSMELDAAKEFTAGLGQNLGTTVSITNQSAGGQLLSELGKGVIQGTSQYLSKKMRIVRIHLKADYNLLLHQK